MCGRFLLTSSVDDLLTRYNLNDGCHIEFKRGDIYPSDNVPIVTNSKKLELFKWGFELKGMERKIINARAESIDIKPAFRESFLKRRCLIPSNAFYEWKALKKGKEKYKINLPDESIFSLAGIYNYFVDSSGNVHKCFAIITTLPNNVMEKIHPRMPSIISREDEEFYLSGGIKDIENIKNLLKPYKSEGMIADKQNENGFEQIEMKI